MRIEQVPGLDVEQISHLRAIGIHNCKQLLRASRQWERFPILSEATRLPSEVLRRLVGRAELCGIRGIGPATLALLCKLEVDSVAALAEQEPEALRSRLRQFTPRPPNLAVIEDWIWQARQRKGGPTGRLSRS